MKYSEYSEDIVEILYSYKYLVAVSMFTYVYLTRYYISPNTNIIIVVVYDVFQKTWIISQCLLMRTL